MADLTKKAILQSFVKFLSEKSFDKITVKDIVEDCGITRRTFYYHFEDIYDLTKYLFEAETVKFTEDYKATGNWQESFISASRFITENKQAVYHLYNSVHREELEKFISHIADKVITSYLDDISGDKTISQDDRELIGDFYKFALFGLVRSWLDTGMKKDPEKIVRRLGELFEGNIERSLGLKK